VVVPQSSFRSVEVCVARMGVSCVENERVVVESRKREHREDMKVVLGSG